MINHLILNQSVDSFQHSFMCEFQWQIGIYLKTNQHKTAAHWSWEHTWTIVTVSMIWAADQSIRVRTRAWRNDMLYIYYSLQRSISYWLRLVCLWTENDCEHSVSYGSYPFPQIRYHTPFKLLEKQQKAPKSYAPMVLTINIHLTASHL